MGFIGKVLDFAAPWLKVDRGSGDIRSSRIANPAGFNAAPLPGDKAVLVALPGTGGRVVAVGVIDTGAPSVDPGEAITYARDSSGAVTVSIKLSADGTVLIDNTGGGVIEMAASGEVTINGVTFSTSGKLTAPEGQFDSSLTVGPTLSEVVGHTHICASPGSPSGPLV